MAESKINKFAERTWKNIATGIGSSEVSINLSGYSEVMMVIYNTNGYFVNSAIYPVSSLANHLMNVYDGSGTYFLRIKNSGTKAYVEGSSVFYGEIYAR